MTSVTGVWSFSAVCVFDHSIGALTAYVSDLFFTQTGISDTTSRPFPKDTLTRIEKQLPVHAFPDGLHHSQLDSFCFTTRLPLDEEKDVSWNVSATFIQLMDTQCPPKAIAEALGLDGVALDLVVNSVTRNALQLVVCLLTHSTEPPEIARNSFFGAGTMLDEDLLRIVKFLTEPEAQVAPDSGTGVLPLKLVASQAIFPIRTRLDTGNAFYYESLARCVDILGLDFLLFLKAVLLGQPIIVYGLPLHILTYSVAALKYLLLTANCDAEKLYSNGDNIFPLVPVGDVLNTLQRSPSVVGTSSLVSSIQTSSCVLI
jgi:hypothetical protein